MTESFITIKNCRVENSKQVLIHDLSWEMKGNEAWLIIGPNGGGKADFVNALCGSLKITPNNVDSENLSLFSNAFSSSTELVSLERAARLIQEERENDESEYVEGGVDIGRTGRIFISGAPKSDSKLNELSAGKKEIICKPEELDSNPIIKLCGIEKILDRGLKYMSTGEIRRTLLAKALISGKKLLILSDPFSGLDVQSRKILLDFFDTIAKKQIKKSDDNSNKTPALFPHIIMAMERWHEIPSSITNVLEFTDKKISFCGTRSDYEALLLKRKADSEKTDEKTLAEFSSALKETLEESSTALKETSTVVSTAENISLSVAPGENTSSSPLNKTPLVQMTDVNVGWGDHQVLRNLSWTLYPGEHWLIQGPNGSGKTTFLELITGDNMQVFSNDVRIFGNRRGSGESIWDIKKKLGIVSYRLHVEYRMLGGISLQNVIISGFKDSIGLYEQPTDIEIASARKWLKLGGFEGRENQTFGSLSYGEQRAILILRSAVKSPAILILDEPCHGLDEQYRNKILNLMNTIGDGGTTTMLHVTHDPAEILECEKHVLELHPDEDPMYLIKTRD